MNRSGGYGWRNLCIFYGNFTLYHAVLHLLPSSASRRHLHQPPFYCDYSTNIKLEGSFYANFDTVILDCAEVRLGTGVLFSPKC